MVACKNIRVRQKHYKRFYWCKYLKQQITLEDCKSCLNLIVVRNKPIKKVSSKRIVVKDETYNKVFDRDRGCCRVCGNPNIEIHHIKYRSERQDLINDINNCVMLCIKHHELVHSNKRVYQPQLLEQVNSGKRIVLKENLEDEQSNS